MKRNQLIGYIQYYERLLDDLRERTFYAEDGAGILRRWYPPTPLNLDVNSKKEQK